ncbi:MAG: ubiquinol-cytochrome C chaperone family protein [Pseudomonadota bacterium]
MLKWLKTRANDRDAAHRIYDAIVEGARASGLYAGMGVPDTMIGRYELISLHLILAMDRLRNESETADRVARRTLERFIEDMDDCMREIGVGDLTVPKRVKKAARGFYDRAEMLEPGLRDRDAAAVEDYFTKTLIEPFEGDGVVASEGAEPDEIKSGVQNQPEELATVHQGGTGDEQAMPPNTEALADYAQRAYDRLKLQSADDILRIGPVFPAPFAFSGDEEATGLPPGQDALQPDHGA